MSKERLLASGNKLDWFEKQDAHFFDRVRQGYLWLAKEFNIEVIDGDRPMEEVAEDVFSALGQIAIYG